MLVKKERSILVLTTALVLCALSIVLFDGLSRPEQEDANRRLQREFRGLGLGAAIRGDWGFASYDPRIDGERETDLWPVPGGYAYSPEEGMMGTGGSEMRQVLAQGQAEGLRTAWRGR